MRAPQKRIFTRILGGIALLLASFAGGFVLRGCSRNALAPTTQHLTPAEAPDAPAAKARMYYCSMHPQVRSPDPNDKCPICFMDLIPLPDDDGDDADTDEQPRLRLSARAAALMDIRTLPAERREVEIEIDLFGKVGYDESRLYEVVARTEAYVERLIVNTPWQPVVRGETLAEFYSPAVVTAFRELLVVSERPEGGAAEVMQAARARLERMGVNVKQIDETIESGKIPRGFRVESPASGAAEPMVVREGEWLREGGRLTRIADMSRVWVNLEAYERDLPWLKEGMPVRFTVAALPGEEFDGEIVFVYPVVSEFSRTVRLRVEADNPDGRLKPEMLVSATGNATLQRGTGDNTTYGNARLMPGMEKDATLKQGVHIEDNVPGFPLVIPVTAPLITGRRALVYVRLPDTDRPVFEPREVVLGPRAGDVYIVVKGLDEGDLVVVNGQFKIDSELQIRGRPSMMTAERPGVRETRDAGVERPEAEAKVDEVRLQTECPVMGGKINRDFYHDHDGRRIYVCCPGCLDEVRERAGEIIEEQRKKGVVFEKVEK